ncbi:MAG: metallophosphoesterase [Deltaproteobacteria bacterium]|nr:metallophosphoesterase [Deltaproteobacteria bacterium]
MKSIQLNPQKTQTKMLWNIALFLSSILTLITLIHSVIYFSLISFLPDIFLSYKRSLVVILLLLSTSLFIASILVHISHNLFTRTLYGISALWYGFATFAFVASILIWMIKGMLLLIPSVAPQKILSIAAVTLYAAAVCLVLFGFINAFRLQTRRISVEIRNLPPQWQTRTIVHLSDLHIGSFWGRAFLEKVVQRVNRLEPDILAITGDLFDGASGQYEKYVDVLQKFKADKAKLYISGNHEVYAGWKEAGDAVRKAGFVDLDNCAMIIDGLGFIGIGSPRPSAKRFDLVSLMSNVHLKPESPKVLLYHTPTDAGFNADNRIASHSTSYLAPRTRFQNAIELGISLQLSGHTHAGQYIPFTWLTQRIYNNYHYGLHRIKDFHLNVQSGTGTWGPPLRIGSSSEIVWITLSKAR